MAARTWIGVTRAGTEAGPYGQVPAPHDVAARTRQKKALPAAGFVASVEIVSLASPDSTQAGVPNPRGSRARSVSSATVPGRPPGTAHDGDGPVGFR